MRHIEGFQSGSLPRRSGTERISTSLRAAWSGFAATWRRDAPHAPARESTRRAFYPGLDLLRGFAALTVVIYHVIEWLNWSSFPAGDPFSLWFRLGWIGVDLFFVISGFVIALSALELSARHPSDFRAHFCRRRLSRIVPLHYLTCLVYTVFVTPALMFTDDFLGDATSHLFFVHNLYWKTQGSINGPNWSLGVEMQFYLLLLISVPLLRRMRPITVLVGCVGVAWLWRAWVFANFCGEVRSGVNMTWFGVSQVPGALDEFGFGIMLAILLHRDTSGRIHGFLHATRYLWPVATAVMARLTMMAYWRNPSFWGDWKLVIFWKTLLAASCLLAVISACAINDRWFQVVTSPLRYLGKISYGIYLWHIPVLFTLKPLLGGDPARACRWTVGLTLLLASLSWHLFEKPMLDRFSRDKRSPGPSSVGHSRCEVEFAQADAVPA